MKNIASSQMAPAMAIIQTLLRSSATAPASSNGAGEHRNTTMLPAENRGPPAASQTQPAPERNTPAIQRRHDLAVKGDVEKCGQEHRSKLSQYKV
jgi:hypothetical protein